MSEEAWFAHRDFRQLYGAIRDRVTTRQARLLMATCCRTREDLFFDPRINRAVELAEKCADDVTLEVVRHEFDWQLSTSPRRETLPDCPSSQVIQAVIGITNLLDEIKPWENPDESYVSEQCAVAHAAYLSLRSHPTEIYTGGEGDAIEYCVLAIESANRLVHPDRFDDDITCRLLRDIFGNPFRPVAFDPAWRSETAAALASGIYAEQAFDRLPILADALEEAGCDHAAVLAHCRGPGPHARGCWVVDLVLDKT